MKKWNPLDEARLSRQYHGQLEKAWNVENDFNWAAGIDFKKAFLPLDQRAIAFPTANARQRQTLSQYFGLVLNATISEMEGVIPKLKYLAWEKLLENYPVNPEIISLGEQFFDEEIKHSQMFNLFINRFCEQQNLDRNLLNQVLPQSFGSYFLKKITDNAKKGGFSFWWVVSAVEEVSIDIFKLMKPYEDKIDPLFFDIHKKHFEEEARHKNYAFLMLEIAYRKKVGLKQWWHQKTDLLLAQSLLNSWFLSELQKIYIAKKLAHIHPFLKSLSECLPELKKGQMPLTIFKLFQSTPYISHLLNITQQKHTYELAKQYRALRLPLPHSKYQTVSVNWG